MIHVSSILKTRVARFVKSGTFKQRLSPENPSGSRTLPRPASSAFIGLFGHARKSLVLLAALSLLPSASAIERSDEIKRIHGAYRPAEEFFRVSEYFTGRENQGRMLIRRSRPDHREGYYITVRLRSFPYDEEVEEAARLEIIPPGSLEPETHWFSLAPIRPRNPEILLGVTGPDWPENGAEPLAWRLVFHDADGEKVASAQSFLWEMP